MPRTGNVNALKHGLYAKRFTKEQIAGLRQMPSDDLRQEVALLRVTADKIFGMLISVTDDADALAKSAAALAAAVTTLNTTMRTHALLTGDYSPLQDADDEAILKFDPYR